MVLSFECFQVLVGEKKMTAFHILFSPLLHSRSVTPTSPDCPARPSPPPRWCTTWATSTWRPTSRPRPTTLSETGGCTLDRCSRVENSGPATFYSCAAGLDQCFNVDIPAAILSLLQFKRPFQNIASAWTVGDTLEIMYRADFPFWNLWDFCLILVPLN